MFRRFFDEGLAQASFLIACSRTRQAVVVDPRRDVDAYVAAARDAGFRLTHAVDTHVHADFVSGAHELQALGAGVVAGPGAGLRFPHHEIVDGETLAVGDLQLTFLHTPGHTPEHLSVIVRQPDAPVRVLTGDTLFVGSVGRPDLLGAELVNRLAAELYDSLHHKLLTLDDLVEVHPGHGAGSLCGAGIGAAPFTTIGAERRTNPWLAYRSRDEFAAAVLADLPETPGYFTRMKQVNLAPPLLTLGDGVEAPPALAGRDAKAAVDRGAWLIDVRTAAAFGAGHAAGALHLAEDPHLSSWAGWVVPPDRALVLVGSGDREEASRVRRLLLRVGLDNVAGFVDGGFGAWRDAGLPTAQTAQIQAADLRARLAAGEPMTIVDVRNDREWRAGHLPAAVHIPVSELASRASELPPGTPLATICEGGYRSSLASSILERAGAAVVVNVVGGMRAWRESGRTAETGEVHRKVVPT